MNHRSQSGLRCFLSHINSKRFKSLTTDKSHNSAIMNASLSSINIQCFMESCSDISTMQESHASSLQSYDRSMCAMDTEYILELTLLPGTTDSPRGKTTACAATRTITPESTNSSKVQPNKNSMLARRKRAMFRRALSCESLGGMCPAENTRPQRPRRRRLKPRRAQSTPENGGLVQGSGDPKAPSSSLTPEAVATLKAKRWETSTVDTAPPIQRVSSRGCCSEGKQRRVLSKLSRWETDESIDHSRHSLNRWETDDSIDHSGHSKRKNKNASFTRGPPQRKSSDYCGKQGEAAKEGDIPKVLSAPNVSHQSREAPVLLASKNHVFNSMPCLSPKGQGRWNAVRPASRGVRGKANTSLSPTSSRSRGCPSLPKRQLTPVRGAPKV